MGGGRGLRTTDREGPGDIVPPDPVCPAVADQDEEGDGEDELKDASEVEEFRVGERREFGHGGGRRGRCHKCPGGVLRGHGGPFPARLSDGEGRVLTDSGRNLGYSLSFFLPSIHIMQSQGILVPMQMFNLFGRERRAVTLQDFASLMFKESMGKADKATTI